MKFAIKTFLSAAMILGLTGLIACQYFISLEYIC